MKTERTYLLEPNNPNWWKYRGGPYYAAFSHVVTDDLGFICYVGNKADCLKYWEAR